MTNRVVLDPTSERQLATRELLARPKSIVDQTVGLLDISKARG
ncbi:MAG: UGSC-containing protein, partial [Actinomycetota bacterium]